MSLHITAVSNEPLYPNRVVPRTLIDILEVLENCNIQITLVQPGSREWESNENSFRVVTFLRTPSYFKSFFKALERSNGSLFKALASFLNPTIYPILFRLSKSSDVIMCYEITYSIPVILVAKITRKPVILLGDILYISYFRKAKFATSMLMRLLLIWEKSAESLVNRIAVWGRDDERFLVLSGICKEKIRIIPLSIDLEKIELMSKKHNNELSFRMLNAFKGKGFKILMFHGTLEYGPNKSCVEYIVDELAPKMLQKYDNVIFAIVGAHSNRIIPTDKRIVFTGYVDNLFSIVNLADIGIVPLTSGTGVKNKVLEYFALSKPVVTTEIGAENLDVTNMFHCIITDIETFPDKVLYLLDNPTQSVAIGQNGRDYVQENHQLKNYERYIELARVLLKSKIKNARTSK